MYRRANASNIHQLDEAVGLYTLDVIHMILGGLTKPNQRGDVAIRCHLAVWDFLYGRVYGVEEGSCLI